MEATTFHSIWCIPITSGFGGPSAIHSRTVKQVVPVEDIRVEDSLTDGLETVDVLDRLERADGCCVRLSESLGPLTNQEPSRLLQPSIIDDFSIGRRLVHRLNPPRTENVSSSGKRSPINEYVAVQSVADLDPGSPLMRSAIRRTSLGKSPSGTSVNAASGTSPTPAVRKNGGKFVISESITSIGPAGPIRSPSSHSVGPSQISSLVEMSKRSNSTM